MPRHPYSCRPGLIIAHVPEGKFRPGENQVFPTPEFLQRLKRLVRLPEREERQEALMQWAEGERERLLAWIARHERPDVAHESDGGTTTGHGVEALAGGGEEAQKVAEALPASSHEPQSSAPGPVAAHPPSTRPTLCRPLGLEPLEVACIEVVPPAPDRPEETARESERGEREERRRLARVERRRKNWSDAWRSWRGQYRRLQNREQRPASPPPAADESRRSHPGGPNPVRDPPGGVCFNCWQRGHSRRTCPRPPRRDYCMNCGRRGAEIQECPRCSDRYRERQQRWEARSGHRDDEIASRASARTLSEERRYGAENRPILTTQIPCSDDRVMATPPTPSAPSPVSPTDH